MYWAGEYGREVVLLQVATARGEPRRMDAYRFIRGYIVENGKSPSMLDIAYGLDVSRQRAKDLVDQLTGEGKVQRSVGVQRGITIPGLDREIAFAKLREEGFVINEDVFTIGVPLPQSNLSLVAIIEHLPDDARPTE